MENVVAIEKIFDECFKDCSSEQRLLKDLILDNFHLREELAYQRGFKDGSTKKK